MSSQSVSNDQLEFWDKNRWSKGLTPWHLAKPHAHLIANHDKLLLEGKKPADTTVLVPLCGKSVDLIWLWQQGFTVVGVDGVEKAIVTFRDENNLPLTRSVNADGLIIYSTEDNKLSLVVANFLDANLFNSFANKFDAVWDRASLVAISPDSRDAYRSTISKLLNARGFRYLLSTYEYKFDDYQPPPYSVDLKVAKSLFSDLGDVKQLSISPLEADLGAGRLFESGVPAYTGVYLISK